jgi:putative ABC transport system permease protein
VLIKLAWRNIWRNKRRSLIVVGSVVVGVIAAILMDALQGGMIHQMLFNQINLNVSNVQIHKKGFRDKKNVSNFIANPSEVEAILKKQPNVKYYSKRVITFGLLSSSDNSGGVYIYGINPEKEKFISIIGKSIVKGKYFTGGEREIVLSKRLAEKLNVGLGDKVVAMANTPSGSIGSEVFRVVGIFKTASSEFDKTTIFIPLPTAQRMLNIKGKVHEFAIITDKYENAELVTKSLRKKLDDKFEAFSYTELLPLLVLQMDLYKQLLVIVNLIIALALIFGIINAMLMAVYERIQEIGVLMSIGMKNSKIFSMILTEAFIIGVLGTIVGLIFGYGINDVLLSGGVDLRWFAESLSSFGVGAIIYPKLSLENFIQIIIIIPMVSVIGAAYPAFKAIRLEPVSAIRYV